MIALELPAAIFLGRAVPRRTSAIGIGPPAFDRRVNRIKRCCEKLVPRAAAELPPLAQAAERVTRFKAVTLVVSELFDPYNVTRSGFL